MKTSLERRSINRRKQSVTRPFRMPALLGALLCVAGLLVSPGKSFSQVPQGVSSITDADRQGSSDTPDATPTPTLTPTVQRTVKTNPTGRSFTVDGTTYTATQRFSWVSGSTHTIATTSPQSGGTGVQYTWSSWSDHGTISHTVAPTANTTYTATFKTQHFLTMSHGTGGTVRPASDWN